MTSVETFLATYSPEVRALALAARALIGDICPQIEETVDLPARIIGYGYGPGYNGTLFTLIMSKDGVKIGVVRGAELPDPRGLLTGAGKVHRHVPLKTVADLEQAGLKPLLKVALTAWKARNRSMGRAKALVIVVALTASVALQGMYMRPQLEIVPVARLIANLEEFSQAFPADASIRLNLARVHAMAYAQKTESAQVQKGDSLRGDRDGIDLDKGVWFGHEPKLVPFEVKPAKDRAQTTAAQGHLTRAIALYAEVVKQRPDDLVAQLGYGWCLDQSGDKKRAIAILRGVIDQAWTLERGTTRANLGWRSISSEGAGYLIPLLDPEKDKVEIATLRDRIVQMGNVLRPITPIVVALDDAATLADIVDFSARVAFDADGSGAQRQWTWITPKAGWLVYDPKGSGRISSALQLFGGVTFWLFWENGYVALGALDDDHDGKLLGPELAGLGIWRDVNRNGISEEGEVAPLSAWGITEVSTIHEDDESDMAVAFSRAGVTFKNGSTASTYDVLLHRR